MIDAFLSISVFRIVTTDICIHVELKANLIEDAAVPWAIHRLEKRQMIEN